MTLRQRQPRVEDSAWLAIVRRMPCLICGKPGSDPAHLRSAAPHYGKRQTGMGEKPDDRWTLPLCRTHHDEQHRGSELAFWLRHGFADPFAVAAQLYAGRPVSRPRAERKSSKARTRKPKDQRRKIFSKTKIPSRPMRPRAALNGVKSP